MCIKLSHQKFKIDNVNSCKLHYQLILKKFLDTLKIKELSEKYIYRNKREIKLFFKYLWSSGIYHISQITNEIIYNYIATLDKYSQGNKYNVVSKIRGFFKFLYLYKYTKVDLSLTVPKIPINHNKIPNTIWSSEDIDKILNSIDTSSNLGKRNYAMLNIMIYLGLRFVDIKNLKFENIDWQKNVINLNQNKTKKYVTLPLLNNVGTAIVDYIKNGRPNANSKYIFLNNRNEKFSPNSDFYYTFRKYLKLAKIDISNKKCIGTYSLRHSLATTLLQNRTPLSTISAILGHTDINNTAIYLKVDVPSLRECCLDLEVNS